MAFLEAFSDDEKTLLVSLPYKAGVWISLSDQKGAGAAAAHELKTIESVIKTLSEGMFRSAFVHEVMSETHLRHDDWVSWAEQTGNILDESRRAVSVLKAKAMPQDAEAYVQTVMSIAYETAYAFREFDRSASIPIRIWVWLCLMWEAFIRTGNKDYRVESMANISLAEEEAIARLAEALTLVPPEQMPANLP